MISAINCHSAIRKLKLSFDRTKLLTSHNNFALREFMVRIWDIETWDVIHQIAFDEPVRDFSLSPDNSHLAVITADDTGTHAAETSVAHSYDLIAGEPLCSKTIPDCRCVTFIDNQVLVNGRLNRYPNKEPHHIDFYVWPNFEEVSTVALPSVELPFELIFLPSHLLLLVMGIGLIVLDPENKVILQEIHCDNVKVDWDIWETTSLTVNSNASLIALGFAAYGTGKRGKRVSVFALPSREITGWYVDSMRYPKYLAISDDGKYLAATLGETDSILVTELGSGIQMTDVSVGEVTGLAFLPGSSRLIVGSKSEQPLIIMDWESSRN